MRKIFFHIVFYFGIIFITELFAQHTCSSSEAHQKRLQEDPAYRQKHHDIEEKLLQKLQSKSQNPALRATPATYVLPVVFHIVHNGGPENISDALVLAALQHLNDAFEHVAPYDGANGVDTKIEFCLAKQTPTGQATTGINRVINPLTNMDMNTDDLALKNLIRWDPTQYINIWLVKEICTGPNCSVAGYAYYAASHGTNLDGIVAEASFMGSSTNNTKVLVHEMGHYLNLYHTFEGGCTNGNCLTDGDRVCDTPPDNKNTPALACAPENTCSSDPISGFGSDVNDYINNFMDYSGLPCISSFTAGQRVRMHDAITGPRLSLLSSIACNSPCPSPSTISFTASAVSGNVGDSFTFTNTSIGTGLTYEWEVNGVLMSSNPVSFTHTFNSAGTFQVKLRGKSTDPLCLDKEYVLPITITCPVNASFTSSATNVPIGTTVTFTNTSIGATSYSWYIQGVYQGNNLNSYTFNSATVYKVMLVAYNGICPDTAITTIVVTNSGGACNNMDFETGNTGGWIGYTADLDIAGNLVNVTPTFDPDRHKITSSGYDETIGGTILPKVAPGGNYSIRLENRKNGAMVAMLEQTFLVTPATAYFIYKYAVVLEDPGSSHPDPTKPFFSVSMRDQSGNVIPCADYKVIAKPPLTGFINKPGTDFWYRNWTTVSVPLTAYIGQNVTVRYAAGDCAYSGHLGYAYLDGSCQGFEVTSESALLCPPDIITLNGPAGFANYSWSGPGIVGPTNTKDAQVNAVGTYQLTVTPIDQPTCGFTKNFVVTTGTPLINAGPDITVCQNSAGVQLHGSGGSKYSWSPTTGLSNPNIANPTLVPGVTTTYTLTSCGISDQVTVTVVPGFSLKLPNDTNICEPSYQGNLYAIPSKNGAYTYSWTPTQDLSDPTISNPQVNINSSTTFEVLVKDAGGCSIKDSVKINMLSFLPLSITANPLGLCKNNAVTTVTLHATTDPAATVEWKIGATSLGFGNTKVITPNKTTTYTAIATAAPCKNEEIITVPYYSIDAGMDTTICGNTPFRLHGKYYSVDEHLCNYTISNINFVGKTIDASYTPITVHYDDGRSGALPIGFQFDFYCRSNTQFYASSNGFIMFDSTNGKSQIPQKLPDMDVPNNLIAIVWSDLFALSGTTMTRPYYKVSGVSPNRVLTVIYPMFYHKNNNLEPITAYANLFETTNVIEIHTQMQFVTNQYFTQGLENWDGSKASPVPARNRAFWAAQGSAYRFTPTSNVVYSWTPSPLADGNTLNPLVNPATTTTYTVTANNGICSTTDQVQVIVNCTPLDLQNESDAPVEDISTNNFLVFPLPIEESGILKIQGFDFHQFQVLDLIGRNVLNGKPDKESIGMSLNLKSVESGMYVIKLIGNSEVRSIKVRKIN